MSYYVVSIIIVSLDPLSNFTIISWLLLIKTDLQRYLSDLLKITNESQTSILQMDSPTKFPGTCTCPSETAGKIDKNCSEKL